MKIITVIGARPQFIKAATVSAAFAKNQISEVLLHTGQHYDSNMSDVFFEELGIPTPQYHLGVGSGAHGAQTGKMLEAIETVLLKEKPDWVLVYGDTNSTLAGALAASKLHIPVAHVEAGLRSFNRKMPEEINRVVTDHLSSLLFPPTQLAVQHLANEGITGAKVHMVGDVMYDAALYFGKRAINQSQVLATLGVEPKQYILTTIHRAENTDDPARLGAIAKGLIDLSHRYPVVWPVHPRTKGVLQSMGLLEELSKHLILSDPAGYLDMVMLEKQAMLIVTDSGGVQKEAFFHRVPCITLRTETEWVELVEMGWNQLVDPSQGFDLLNAAQSSLKAKPRSDLQPYGHGNAAERIVQAMRQNLAEALVVG